MQPMYCQALITSSYLLMLTNIFRVSITSDLGVSELKKRHKEAKGQRRRLRRKLQEFEKEVSFVPERHNFVFMCVLCLEQCLG